jgi:ABC-type antimicrobial peptide transport system permease subunit
MRIPLVEGRDFRTQDNDQANSVAIVNEAFAQRFFAGRNVVGRRLRGWGRTLVIVGIAKDTKYAYPTEGARAYLYVPFRQFAGPETETVLHVATDGAPESVLQAAEREIKSNSALAFISYGMPLKDYIGAAVFKHKMAAALMSVLGTTALILAALGVYGVVGHSVTQRTNEIGIRIALGASDKGILKLIVLQGVRVAAIGLGTGAIAVVALSRLLATLLYNVDPLDRFTLLLASLLLLGTALLASSIPAYRASRMDPLKALRVG